MLRIIRTEQLLPTHVRAHLLQHNSCGSFHRVTESLRFFKGLFCGNLVPGLLVKPGELIMNAAILIGGKAQLVFRIASGTRPVSA